MGTYSIPLKEKNSSEFELSDWELEVIDLFLNAANSVGLPKSFGQIYGLLFCRDQALTMDQIIKLLGNKQRIGKPRFESSASVGSSFVSLWQETERTICRRNSIT